MALTKFWACKTHYFMGTWKPGIHGYTSDDYLIKPLQLYTSPDAICTPTCVLAPIEEICGCFFQTSMTSVAFPNCCGARVIVGLNGLTKESLEAEIKKHKTDSGPGILLAISTSIQSGSVHQALLDCGFTIASQFKNPYHSMQSGVLTLWFKTLVPELKPETPAVKVLRKRVTKSRVIEQI